MDLAYAFPAFGTAFCHLLVYGSCAKVASEKGTFCCIQMLHLYIYDKSQITTRTPTAWDDEVESSCNNRCSLRQSQSISPKKYIFNVSRSFYNVFYNVIKIIRVINNWYSFINIHIITWSWMGNCWLNGRNRSSSLYVFLGCDRLLVVGWMMSEYITCEYNDV